MTKAELIERIARSRSLPSDITKKDIERILTVAFEEIASYFIRARVTRTQAPKFSFPHFGTFVKKRRSARRGVNPRTLEPMQIEAFYSLDFRNSSELRDAMNQARSESDQGTRRRARTPSIEIEPAELWSEAEALESEIDERLPIAPLQRVRVPKGSTRVRTA